MKSSSSLSGLCYASQSTTTFPCKFFHLLIFNPLKISLSLSLSLSLYIYIYVYTRNIFPTIQGTFYLYYHLKGLDFPPGVSPYNHANDFSAKRLLCVCMVQGKYYIVLGSWSWASGMRNSYYLDPILYRRHLCYLKLQSSLVLASGMSNQYLFPVRSEVTHN